MRIAILGSVVLPVPPILSGGTEWIAYYQARGLAMRGHSILLVGAEGTKRSFTETSVKVFEVGRGEVAPSSSSQSAFDPQVTESSRKLRLENVSLSEVAKILIDEKESYDVILNNMRGEAVFLPVAQLLKKLFVNVMHLNLFDELSSVFKEYDAKVITISNAQRKGFPDLSYLGTVYNCVDLGTFSFNKTPKNYLLMVGTVGRHKNQKAAIEVARKTGKKLIIVGKVRDQDYFDEMKPDLQTGQIEYRGEVAFSEKLKLYQEAEGLLFPVLWEEPFGLVMIEAMACGTPVIAFNHGAVPEVVVDGETGYIVNGVEEMSEAVGRLGAIDRGACRKHVEELFTPEKMVETLEKALLTI